MSDDNQSLEQQLNDATADLDDAALEMEPTAEPSPTEPDTYDPAEPSGADEPGGEPGLDQQPPAPEPFDPIAEYRARYGTDPPITDPRQLVAGTFDTVEHLQQELEQQRRLAQHWYQEYQQRQQPAQQPQQPAEPEPEPQSWMPPLPEWNPKWESMLQRSAEGGIEIRPEYRAIAPPDLPQKYVAYQQARNERLEMFISGDPAETLWQGLEKKVEEKAAQLMQQRLGEMQRQAAEQAYVEQNKEMLLDANGNPTPFYHQVSYHYQNLTQNGVQPELAQVLAHRQAMLDAMLQQQQQQQAHGGGNPQAAQAPSSATPQTPEESRRQFERQNNRPRRPVAGSPTGGGPRDPEVYPSLKEQLRAQLQDVPERLLETS